MAYAVAVDFDGVIHKYSQGWKDGSIYDEPVYGAKESLIQLMDKYAVFILTTRDTGDVAIWIKEQFDIPCVTQNDIAERSRLGFTYDDLEFWKDQSKILVTNRKLPALFYIDDRAVRFENWPDTLSILKEILLREIRSTNAG